MDPTNNGLVTRLQPGHSQELDDELLDVAMYEQRASHIARDDCPCRHCRKARRRAAEVGLSPLEKLELVPEWKRVAGLLAILAVVIAAIGIVLGALYGIVGAFGAVG